MKVIAIIPARYASSRFPGKPLIDIGGKSMIQRVVEQAKQAEEIEEVIVATDDKRIYDHVLSIGGHAVMTSPDHVSGTDRCLEAYDKSGTSADVVLNIQGDEPFVDPTQLKALIKCIGGNGVEIATLAKKIEHEETLFDPNKVKVVCGQNGRAIYFSRHPIPFQKSIPQKLWLDNFDYYKHLGLYAYRVDVLREICAMNPSPLELAESLEQLRWLENGKNISVAFTEIETPAIDTPDDLQFVLNKMGM